VTEADKGMGAVVVGTGFGCLTHVRALREAGFDVQALVGRDPKRTELRAERFGIPVGTTSLAAALALPGVELVAVATPPHTHAAIVLEAVAAGKHVVCEKPFARDAAEARTMLAAAEEAGVVHLLGTEFRFGTAQALLTRLVGDGAVGTPRLATFLLLMPLLADPGGDVPEWWARAEDGGGWLGAHATHVIDQIRATLGEFSGVSASLSRVSDRPMSADDAYTVHFRTESGVDGIMQSSGSVWGPPVVTTRISGDQGTVWIEGDRVWLADAQGQRIVDPPNDLVTGPPNPPPADLLVTTYDLMHSTGIDMGPYTRLFETVRLTAGGQPVPSDPAPATFADGVASMEVMDAIRRSAVERRWVDL
jgi:predicted dehydrogenase